MKVLTDREKLDIALELLNERQSEEWYQQCEQLEEPPDLAGYLAVYLSRRVRTNECSPALLTALLKEAVGSYESTFNVKITVK